MLCYLWTIVETFQDWTALYSGIQLSVRNNSLTTNATNKVIFFKHVCLIKKFWVWLNPELSWAFSIFDFVAAEAYLTSDAFPLWLLWKIRFRVFYTVHPEVDDWSHSLCFYCEGFLWVLVSGGAPYTFWYCVLVYFSGTLSSVVFNHTREILEHENKNVLM